MFPLFRYFLVQLQDNRKSIGRIERVKDFVDKEISNLKISGFISDIVLNYKIRAIQDEIFSHRATCASIQNIIQFLMKKNNENVYNDYF